jgi:hypothetical protein
MLLSMLIVWLAYAILFAFSIVCLASGLFYIAEFVEEYTVWTKKILKYSIFVSTENHVGKVETLFLHEKLMECSNEFF